MEVTTMLAYFRKITTKQAEGDEGASAVEYGLLVAAIAAIIILVVFALGTFVKGAFKDTCDAFHDSNAVNATGPANSSCDQ
jgi:pilus assembly protein Flp/PilA